MYSVITAVPMHLSRLMPIVRWAFRGAKKLDSILPYTIDLVIFTYGIEFLYSNDYLKLLNIVLK